jgi:hypothetical protein
VTGRDEPVVGAGTGDVVTGEVEGAAPVTVTTT